MRMRQTMCHRFNLWMCFASLGYSRMHLHFRKFDCEIVLYFTVYISYLLYGLWALFSARDHILAAAKFDFAPGWLLGRPRDDTNDELEYFTRFVQSHWQWYLLHVVVSAVVRKFWPQRQSSGHIFVTALVLVFTFRAISVAVLMTLLLSYYAISRQGTKSLTWLLTVVWIVVINLIKQSTHWYETLGYVEYFKLFLILSWSLLRCCSFNLNRISDNKSEADHTELVYSLENFLGYTLYFPNLVHGPFWGFSRYAVHQQVRQHTKSLRLRSLSLAWQLMRVAFWWLILQLALHFLYIHYMAHDVSVVKLVKPLFGQHAVGYFMGQFFYIYYVVAYGLAIALARFDGLNPPNLPRCIGRIHYYSDMWKYFDEGLYEFLFRHIYAELCCKQSSLTSKLAATAATFAFVFVWHGCYTYVLIWSVLNFGCLVAEKCFKALMSSLSYTEWANRRLGVSGALRLRALLGTQIFIPAAFSNVYFISGGEVGSFLMRGAYMNGFWNFIALTLCSYCFFQCSEVLLNRKEKKTKQL